MPRDKLSSFLARGKGCQSPDYGPAPGFRDRRTDGSGRTMVGPTGSTDYGWCGCNKMVLLLIVSGFYVTVRRSVEVVSGWSLWSGFIDMLRMKGRILAYPEKE